MSVKKLIYIANLRLPTEKAYGVNVAETCQAFADAGINVTLVFPYRKNTITENVFSYYGVRNNFRVKMISSLDIYLPGKLDKFSVVFKGFISGLILAFYGLWSGADIIYSRDELPIFLLSFFKKNIYFEAHKFSEHRKFFYRRFLKRGIKIIAISKNLKDRFLDVGFSGENILVAHDGVNLRDFDVQVSKEEARKITNLPQDATITMYTGHLFDWKGADILAMAARTMPDIKFVFVGGTSHDVGVFKRKFGNLQNVIVIGHKPHKEIPIFLKAADILVLPNSSKDKMYSGTSPIKLFEYMASGRPIVASNLPSIVEILNDKNSVLVKSDDHKNLADGIRKIISNVTLSDELAGKAKEDVKNYTWAKRAASIIDFLS